MPAHLFVDISSHGFGHLGQTAPVLAALRGLLPDLRLTVRSGLSRDLLERRISGAFRHIGQASDFGFVQTDAVSIDHAATRNAYLRAHDDFSGGIAREAELLADLSPDLVLSNVSYLPLAGASKAGIAAIAMSSLNWHELARHFYASDKGLARLLPEIESAYVSAKMFLALTPGMPAASFPRVKSIAPVATIAAASERERVRRALGTGDDECLALVAMGGFDIDCSPGKWPLREGLRYLLPATWTGSHPDVLRYGVNEFPFGALLRAADAVITKPGYGTFVEAAGSGVPLLYVRRDDWPEQEFLIEWLQENGVCDEVSLPALTSGAWVETMDRLLERPPRQAIVPTGAMEAARLLAEYLEH